MNTYGWHRSRFSPLGLGTAHVRMGQELPEVQALNARTDEAVAKFVALKNRASLVKDPAQRQTLLDFIGNGSMPGSPSDRLVFVQEDLKAALPWDEVRTQHLDDLETSNADLEARVVNAEKSGSYSVLGPMSLTDAQGKLTGVGVGLIVVAGLALIVVPLTLKNFR